MRDYGNAIKTLRKNTQMTQTMLAEKLNVSGQAVSKWENNMAQPDFETIVKLTEIFEITLDEFSRLCDPETADATPAEEVASAAVAPTVEPAPLLIGVCSKCGLSIYKEENIGSKFPTLVCKECKERIERNKREAKKEEEERRRREEERQKMEMAIQHEKCVRAFRNSMLKPLWFVVPLFIFCLFISPAFSIFIAIFSWLVAVQIRWDNNWISEIFENTFGKTFTKPGLIIPLSVDGLLWALVVKIAMGIIWLLLSIAVTIFGLLFCVVLSPFTFGFALRAALWDVRTNKFEVLTWGDLLD